MEKTINIRNTEITFSVSCMPGQLLPARLTADLGPRRSERIRIDAALGVQRRFGYSVHVRLDPQNHVEQCQGMVPTSQGLQQGGCCPLFPTRARPSYLQTATPILIGTKYDSFTDMSREEQEEVTKQAKRFSKAMHAPVVSRSRRCSEYAHPQIFCSTSHSINVQKIFKIVLAKVFDLKVSLSSYPHGEGLF